jgi:hypothetical protein
MLTILGNLNKKRKIRNSNNPISKDRNPVKMK